nr:uncharacterized protein LOC113817031 [Penaeus vannamei]
MCGPSSHGPGALGYPEWPTYLPAAHTQRRRSGREKRLVCVSCYKSESLAGEIPYLQRATCTRGGVVGLNHECGWTSTTSSTPAGPPAASAPAQTTTTLRRRASTATTKVFSLHLFLTTVLLFIANLQPTSAGLVLSEHILHYEPVFYDKEHLRTQHHRAKRDADHEVHLQFTAHNSVTLRRCVQTSLSPRVLFQGGFSTWPPDSPERRLSLLRRGLALTLSPAGEILAKDLECSFSEVAASEQVHQVASAFHELFREVQNVRKRSKTSLLDRVLGAKATRIYVRGKSDSALPKD